MTSKKARFPQVKIRKSGDRFSVRWVTKAGRPAQRAIVPFLSVATEVRDAVKAGADGWAALSEATRKNRIEFPNGSSITFGNERDDDSRITPSVPPSIAGLIAEKERQVRSGELTAAADSVRDETIKAIEDVHSCVTWAEILDIVKRLEAKRKPTDDIQAARKARGAMGGASRAARMTPEARQAAARAAVNKRWARVRAQNEVKADQVNDEAPASE